MQKYVGVKFRRQGQIYYFDPCSHDIAEGDKVLVSTEEGLGLAEVVIIREELPASLSEYEIKPIERVADKDDLQIEQENIQLGYEAHHFCFQQIRSLGLEMKLVDVEVRFDKSKLVFYFTAPARIDFRDLVKILVNQYKTRIELRQIGVRHEAQILGGIGNCGRICCCHQFLRKFDPVTIRMAKEQQLFLNPSKISGACGRLLCCLNFEKDTYADFYRRCPKVGKRYETSAGELKVLRANLFRDSLIVGTKSGDEREVALLEWSSLTIGSERIDSLDNLFESSEEGSQENSEMDEETVVTVHEEVYKPCGESVKSSPKSEETTSVNKSETNQKKGSSSSRKPRKKKNRPRKKAKK